MDELSLVHLPALMSLSTGRADVIVGIVDGPVALDHPDLAQATIKSFPGWGVGCRDPRSVSCQHGTSVVGILAASRQSQPPGIAPECTYVLRPVFTENTPAGEMPTAAVREVAEAIVDCVHAGAHIINLSLAVSGGGFTSDQMLRAAMDFASQRSVLVIAAVGNHRVIGGNMDVLRHACTIPVIAYSLLGQPLPQAHIAASIGRSGLGAPGKDVFGLASSGGTAVFTGTSIAAPFVTGAAVLLRSIYPAVAASEVKHALISTRAGQQRSIVPGLLNAWAAYQLLSTHTYRKVLA